MITGINESKTSTKHLSCKCKYKFNRAKYNLNQWWNNDKCRCERKNIQACEKDYVWNPGTCNCENGQYLVSIMDDSVIICNEVIKSYDEEIRTVWTNFNEKKVTSKTQSFHILLVFLLITIKLLIADSIYCYLVKDQAKQLSLFHDAKFKQFRIDSMHLKWVIMFKMQT